MAAIVSSFATPAPQISSKLDIDCTSLLTLMLSVHYISVASAVLMEKGCSFLCASFYSLLCFCNQFSAKIIMGPFKPFTLPKRKYNQPQVTQRLVFEFMFSNFTLIGMFL